MCLLAAVPQEVAAAVEAGLANMVTWKWLFDSIAAWSLLPVEAYAASVHVNAKGTARAASRGRGNPLATIASPPQLSSGADDRGLIARPKAGAGGLMRVQGVLKLRRSSTTPAGMASRG